MKRIITGLLALSLMIVSCAAIAGCGKRGASDEREVMSLEPSEEISEGDTQKLTNHMTSRELSESGETELQLLDDPWEQYASAAASDYDQFEDKVYLGTEYGAIVYGVPCFGGMLPEGYDGGAGEMIFNYFSAATSQIEEHLLTFEDYDDLKSQIRDEIDAEIAEGYPSIPANEDYDTLIALYDAVIAGQTEQIDMGSFEDYLTYYYENAAGTEDQVDLAWDMDAALVEDISGSIHEYHFYDQELDMVFVVHVVTPPSYDPDQSYPALVMTDAVWRFNDVTSMYGAMERGEADPQYLITIGFDYGVDSRDNAVRGNILCDHKREFLDFITDNMMPYLEQTYSFDHGDSTLFGHSQGGVFTHYAAFNYDIYDNRPFGNYIIGSPTFWTPYFTDVDDYDEYADEYGYFERNDSYDRHLLIAAGDSEDEDYREYYGDNDSTLEGVAHLAERLDSHGVTTYEVRIYESHHYQYVPQLLLEYVRGE